MFQAVEDGYEGCLKNVDKTSEEGENMQTQSWSRITQRDLRKDYIQSGEIHIHTWLKKLVHYY